MLQGLDIAIIIAYLIATILIGLALRKKAQKSKDDYLLGGKDLPWYMLGLSNASGMFDISGTMWLVTLTFVYGLKSIWIPWLWPVFNQVFLMIFLATWLRRSQVTTGAEWIHFRFGKGKGGNRSHSIIVVFAILSCLGFLAYGFIGLGKFVEIFIPWDVVSAYIPFNVPAEYIPHFYGIIFTLFAVFYSILGGMSGIVWTDVLQYSIMTISSIAIAVIAWHAMGDNTLNVPEGWSNPLFGWELDIDWTGIIDEVNAKIASDQYSLFGLFFMLMVFKGILSSIAGPAPNYDMQKILSTKSPLEAAKMSAFSLAALIPTRYLMVGGFSILAILFYDELRLETAGILDFEKILPAAIEQFVPVGLLGLLLAGLLAAFMSTFAGTLNAAQAYLVNDIYLKYNPEASSKGVKNMNYGSGIIVVLISIVLGFFVLDVNSILQWIVSALYGSYVISNTLKWYWWRFNGEGYFWGMVSGIIPAMIIPLLTDTLDLYYFPVILVISLAGSIIGAYSFAPTSEKVLIDFYKKTKPWGFWKPILEKVKKEDPQFEKNTNFSRDMFNVLVGVIAQTLLVLIPLYLILHENIPFLVAIAVLVICVIILKKNWWDHIKNEENINLK
ncbi:MAG: sodium:solute symporter [Zunongwangia sp.]|uniref:Na+/glucose symporter n=2 Tax=Zunongwangia profunda TaxID=398743 RepID=D5BDX4_ZUNPS|nr:sodium:solute symporter family protein [Zunongwangia profunda]MAG85925.1 sodium:solute symporter [Flavobacteriaceae bacterium]MAO37750.1 sodium:solute symporter [Zunongwangia sp.]ADF50715.1 Na+/glucose symporter [Zunongwangia profunda SM-A87]MAS69711.1 sodium:solute symporter [Zunongwangia sp.]HCV81215.1 sodium:solute symporter [Zunongwangia profunda]|tara:strand:- start:985 stop:2820 length:1836 start_codon:yes stop_codon:yes gene_type:complete